MLRTRARSVICGALGMMVFFFTVHSRADCIHVAAEIGLSPAALAVSGLAANDAATALSLLHDADDLRASIAAAKAQLDAANQALAAARVAFSHDPLNVATIAAYESALADAAAEQAQCDALCGQLRDEALDGVGSEALAALGAWRHSAVHDVPDEFRVLLKSGSEWNEVEIALRAERRALQRGEPLAQEHASLLQTIRSDTAVIAAALSLQSNLAAIENVFEQFAE